MVFFLFFLSHFHADEPLSQEANVLVEDIEKIESKLKETIAEDGFNRGMVW